MGGSDRRSPEGGGYWSEAPPDARPAGEVVVAVRGLAPFPLRSVSHAFSPRRLDPGTALLIGAVVAAHAEADAPAPAVIADLGAGYGPVGLALARRFPNAEVHLIERNRAAADVARENAQRLALANARVHTGDVAEVWPTLPAQDLVATNPPIRAGRDVYGPWLEWAPKRLAAGGAFWFVARTAQGATTLQALLARHLDGVGVVARQSGYRVVRGRRPPSAPVG